MGAPERLQKKRESNLQHPGGEHLKGEGKRLTGSRDS